MGECNISQKVCFISRLNYGIVPSDDMLVMFFYIFKRTKTFPIWLEERQDVVMV